jgi:hypothetical protein
MHSGFAREGFAADDSLFHFNTSESDALAEFPESLILVRYSASQELNSYKGADFFK